jgi:hypothetical protein
MGSLRNEASLAALFGNISKAKAQSVLPHVHGKRVFLILFTITSVNGWNEEHPTAHQLFEELQVKGYHGSETLIKDFVTRLRRGLSGMRTSPKIHKNTRWDTNAFSERAALASYQAGEGSHV